MLLPLTVINLMLSQLGIGVLIKMGIARLYTRRDANTGVMSRSRVTQNITKCIFFPNFANFVLSGVIIFMKTLKIAVIFLYK